MKASQTITLSILITCLACITVNSLKAQTKDSIIYPVVIQFNSACCGVPADTPLLNYIKSFKKKYRLKKITALHIGPMGREGEYLLAFPLKELTRKQASAFRSQVKAVTEKLKDRGSATYVERMKVVKSELPEHASVETLVL